jgi:hypothetical protein
MIWRFGPALLLTLLCIAGVLDRLGSPPAATRAEERAPAPAEAIALLDGLVVGEKLAGWTVLGITGPSDNALHIDVARDETRFTVSIAPLGAMEHRPPRSTEHYALYYGHPHPKNTSIPENTIRAILAGVERRVRRNERTISVPGLGKP